jgi:hypothetical protein
MPDHNIFWRFFFIIIFHIHPGLPSGSFPYVTPPKPSMHLYSLLLNFKADIYVPYVPQLIPTSVLSLPMAGRWVYKKRLLGVNLELESLSSLFKGKHGAGWVSRIRTYNWLQKHHNRVFKLVYSRSNEVTKIVSTALNFFFLVIMTSQITCRLGQFSRHRT